MFSYILVISIYYLNMLFAFGKRNFKLIAFLLLMVAYILMVATNNNNGENGDYRAYLELYNHFRFGGNISNIKGYQTDYIYMILMFLLAKLNLSYNLFLGVFTLVAILLIYSTLSKITKNHNLVLLLYMIFPFFYDVIQFRFFFAYSIVIFALKYIIFEEQKSYIKYILLIILASLIHNTVLFFLLYVILKSKLKIFIRLLLVIMTAITILAFTIKINIVDILNPILAIDKIDSYTSGTLSYELNPIVSIIIMLIILYFILVIKKLHMKHQTYTSKQILWLNNLNIVLFPFLVISLDFERFLRPILLINYAMIASYYLLLSKTSKFLLLTSLILILCFRLVMMLGFAEMAFENNYILELINNLFH